VRLGPSQLYTFSRPFDKALDKAHQNKTKEKRHLSGICQCVSKYLPGPIWRYLALFPVFGLFWYLIDMELGLIKKPAFALHNSKAQERRRARALMCLEVNQLLRETVSKL